MTSLYALASIVKVPIGEVRRRLPDLARKVGGGEIVVLISRLTTVPARECIDLAAHWVADDAAFDVLEGHGFGYADIDDEQFERNRRRA
jgi:hypothetical protein